MSTDNGVREALGAAAQTITHMTGAELQDRYRQLQHKRQARDHREIARQQAELRTLNLDAAAYNYASHACGAAQAAGRL